MKVYVCLEYMNECPIYEDGDEGFEEWYEFGNKVFDSEEKAKKYCSEHFDWKYKEVEVE